MATFIAMISLTGQGEKHIEDTVKRADTFREMAEKLGAAVKDIYWTLGKYDGLVVFDAPDDKVAASLIFHLCAKGNVRSNTMRAFDSAEINEVLGMGEKT